MMKPISDKGVNVKFQQLEQDIQSLYQRVQNVQTSDYYNELSPREKKLIDGIKSTMDEYYHTRPLGAVG